mmetsp:Transcript_12303/g.36092  ORF Transcript_12303/g.36092 Transcript_12303/m.36092 type:complete len:445 (-) Transcript_12303:237-1571(-)
MISQFLILSSRGDVIVRRDFLGNVPRTSAEVFFRNCKFWQGTQDEAPPVFAVEGVSYLHMREGGLHLVATTRHNVSPSLVLEFLRRMCAIIRDMCGVLNEEAVRKNFLLVYEVLDEVLDYGVPQNTSTEALKTFVLNEPVEVVAAGLPKMLGLNKGPTGVFKSVLEPQTRGADHKDEIFVDVVERIASTFNSAGFIVSSQVDGSVQIKSYISGNPPIKVKLNDDLVIGKRDNPYGSYESGHTVFLDDCNFHECANLESFDIDRTITLVPPEGEFALLNYRTTGGFKPPFRLHAVMEPDAAMPNKALLELRLWCEVPRDKSASALEVDVPMPRYVQRVHCDARMGGGPDVSEFLERTRTLTWRFKRCGGGQEFCLRARLTLERPYSPSLRSDIGPINLKFTIPAFSVSRLNLKYLQIVKKAQGSKTAPMRWVRYGVSSSSYTFRT